MAEGRGVMEGGREGERRKVEEGGWDVERGRGLGEVGAREGGKDEKREGGRGGANLVVLSRVGSPTWFVTRLPPTPPPAA